MYLCISLAMGYLLLWFLLRFNICVRCCCGWCFCYCCCCCCRDGVCWLEWLAPPLIFTLRYFSTLLCAPTARAFFTLFPRSALYYDSDNCFIIFVLCLNIYKNALRCYRSIRFLSFPSVFWFLSSSAVQLLCSIQPIVSTNDIFISVLQDIENSQ